MSSEPKDIAQSASSCLDNKMHKVDFHVHRNITCRGTKCAYERLLIYEFINRKRGENIF